jgi:peptide-methionine (S)-S-oxide reductase
MRDFVLAGGCFWCLDSAFMQYAGGAVANPTYSQVCDGNTGHAEVARIVFDETVMPAEVILDCFFTIHDPRQLNRQGNDVGTQYRSAMFYRSPAEKAEFEAAIARAAEHWDGTLVTTLEPLDKFWVGEEYHQDYWNKNPDAGYCVAVVGPKVAKARAAFKQYLR